METTGGKGGQLTGGAGTDEALASSKGVMGRNQGGNTFGLQQYFSPRALAKFIVSITGAWYPVADLTAGNGSLLEFVQESKRYGVEIDKDQIEAAVQLQRPYQFLKGDLQHLYPLMRSLGILFPVIVLNPPFSLPWNVPGLGKGSSGLLATRIAQKLLAENGMGVLVLGKRRFDEEVRPVLGEQLFAVIEVEKLFGNVDHGCVVAFWRDTTPIMKMPIFEATVERPEDLTSALAEKVKRANIQRFGSWYPGGSEPSKEAWAAVQAEYNVRVVARLGEDDDARKRFLLRLEGTKLKVRLSSYTAQLLLKKPDPSGTKRWLESFNNQPITYFAMQEKSWRQLRSMAEEYGLELEPRAVAAVEESIADKLIPATPLYPVNRVQRLGFIEDVDSILCVKTDQKRGFVAGKSYTVTCSTAILTKTEEKEVLRAEGPEIQEVVITRKAMKIMIGTHVFTEGDLELEYILEHFDVPDPGDIERIAPNAVAFWRNVLDQVEREIQQNLPGFRFRWFQKEDIARGLVKGSFVLAWEQGLGKALGQAAFVRALELGGRLPDGCALFAMPQDLARQFAAEVKRFFNREVLFVTHTARMLDGSGPKGIGAAMRAMESGTWRPSQPKGPKVGQGEVTAVELAGKVKERRRYLRSVYLEHLKAKAEKRKPEWVGPEVPGVWAVTWYEALAVTGREDKQLPLRFFGKKAVKVLKAEKEGDPEKVLTEEEAKKAPKFKVKTRLVDLHTMEQCPVCRADREGGWDGRRCRAPLQPSEKTEWKDSPFMAERRRAGGWDLRWEFTGRMIQSKVAEKAGVEVPVTYAEKRYVGRKQCGHVDVQVRRKSAYSPLRNVFRVICVDEATKIKGDDSLASLAIRGMKARYKVVATGTPQKNFVIDLFWLLWWALGNATARFPYSYVGGKDRFTADFAVVEGKLDKDGKQQRKKVLPEASNLLRLWKLLCSSVVRRRMDEVGCVVSESGDWKCRGCGSAHTTNVKGPGGEWQKPERLECGACGKVFDSVVPLIYHVHKTPWGLLQKRFFAAWLNEDNFVRHFKKKHPNSPLIAKGEQWIRLLAPAIGQLAKLEYATNFPIGDPDDDYKFPGLSPWTPAMLQLLQDMEAAIRAGKKVLLGTSLVEVSHWVAERLKERGLRVGHITDDDGEGGRQTMSPQDRAKRLKDFRDGKLDGLCVSIYAVALGHNLDHVTDVFGFGFPWDYATWDQYLKRARRLSSRKPVHVHAYFPEGSLGAKKWELLGDKTDSADVVLDGGIRKRHEKDIDKAAILKELQRRGARVDGTEIPEEQVRQLWLQGNAPPPRSRRAVPPPNVAAVVAATRPQAPALVIPSRQPLPAPPTRVILPAGTPAPVQGVIVPRSRRPSRPTDSRTRFLPGLEPVGRTFLLDPPWEEKGGGGRGAQYHYDVMKTKDMVEVIRGSKLLVPAPNAHMYMWVTNNFLANGEAQWLMQQLGFRPITFITWVKPEMGIGQYFRGETEHLMFGVHGQGMNPDVYVETEKSLGTKLVADYVRDEAGEIIHSAKPPEAYRRIMRRSRGRFVEFFNRGGAFSPEWLVWGKEIAKSGPGIERRNQEVA